MKRYLMLKSSVTFKKKLDDQRASHAKKWKQNIKLEI